MKKFWKKSAALLMAISLLTGNNYAVHALDGEGQPPETQENAPEEEPSQELTSETGETDASEKENTQEQPVDEEETVQDEEKKTTRTETRTEKQKANGDYGRVHVDKDLKADTPKVDHSRTAGRMKAASAAVGKSGSGEGKESTEHQKQAVEDEQLKEEEKIRNAYGGLDIRTAADLGLPT